MDKFEIDLLNFIKKESLITDGDSVMLAVSGGADSMAMMYAFSKIREFLKANFLVAHLNHMIREEAKFEGKGVEELSNALGFRCVIGSRNVPEYIKMHKVSVEEGARIVRYEFFETMASEYGMNKIATAHHLSDLTENFFLRLFRGSGIGGLIGMSPKMGKYIKPFLIFDDRRIRDYVKIYKIPFFEDRTNFDTRYLRNRIRHVLIPEIKKDFCPQIEKMVANVSNILKMYQDHIEKEVSEKFDLDIDGKICFKLESLRKEEDLVLSELFKMIFKEMNVNISNRKIESCINVIKKGGVHEINLGHGVYMLKGKKVCIGKKEREVSWNQLELFVPGIVKIEELSVKIYAKFEEGEVTFGDTKHKVTLDAEKITLPLVVRPARYDEKMIPFGMKEEVRVKDILKNKGVPVEMRKVYPVVSQKDGKIIWVVGITFPDDLKIMKDTSKILTLIREGGAF